MQVARVAVGQVARKRKVHVQPRVQAFLRVGGVFAVAVKNRAAFGDALAQHVKNIAPRVAVVDNDGQIVLLRQFQLRNEHFYLGALVAVLFKIVQTRFANRDHVGKFYAFFNRGYPVATRIYDFGRSDAHGMVHARHGFKRVVDDFKIVQAVVYADNTGHSGKFCLLNDAQLFKRIIIYKPDVGVSIKKLHGFFLEMILALFATNNLTLLLSIPIIP